MTAVAGRFVGQSVLRKEDPRLVTGHGSYVDDMTLPGQCHAAFVRSDTARGRITRLDASEAAAAEGVVAVLTAADLNPGAGNMVPTMFLDGSFGISAPLRPLADVDVRFVGDPIAIVLAESRYLAEDACELIEVDIEVDEAVVDFERAAADTEHLVHPELGSNRAGLLEMPNPETEAVFAGAAHVVTETFFQQRQSQAPMETRGVLVSVEPHADAVTMWLSSQMPHEARMVLSRVLDVPEHHVRVIQRDVGGGFGQKGFLYREAIIAALAARAVKRPVKWIEDRRENLISAAHARLDRMTASLALDDDGHIIGAELEHLEDAGAYPSGGTGGGGFLVGALFPGPYHMGAYAWRTEAVWTNTCGRGPYRGPWMAETVAREQMIDVAARSVGMDPLELRRRNVIQRAELPYASAGGMVFDHVTPSESLEMAAQLIDYDGFRAEQAAAALEGRLLGIGIGLYIEPTASRVSTIGIEAATVRVEPSGKVVVMMGTGSHGQSLETTMVQVVADELGVDVDDVVLRQGDTDVAPFGGGTGGSRSAVIAGGAGRAAAAKVREKIVEIAAHAFEASPDDIEIHDGAISVRGTPSKVIPLGQLAMWTYADPDRLPPGMEPGLEEVGRYSPPPITWGNSCHICTCEIDPVTGTVTLKRFVVSEDCGIMINPMIVEGQVAGGVVQGIGGTLYEQLDYDGSGNPLATTFLDYLLPTMAEVPVIEYGHLETPAPVPGGHKGVGEGGAIGSVPAVFNAVNDALALIGARLTGGAMRPSDILAAIETATVPLTV